MSNGDNSKIIFIFLNENICCDSSLELSQQDGSNEDQKICMKNNNDIPKLSSLPLSDLEQCVIILNTMYMCTAMKTTFVTLFVSLDN